MAADTSTDREFQAQRDGPRSRASRPGRLRRRIGFAVAAGLAVFGAWAALAPPAVGRLLRGAIDRSGLGPARLRVVGVSLSRLELASLRLGPTGGIRVESVAVRYRVRDLLRGRVDRIDLDGAAIDVGEVERVVSALPSSAPSGSGSALTLPFRDVLLTNVVLRWSSGTRSVEAGCAAHLAVAANGRLAVAGHVNLRSFGDADGGEPLGGRADFTGSADVLADGAFGRVSLDCRGPRWSLPGEVLSGARLTVESLGEGLRWRLTGSGAPWSFDRIEGDVFDVLRRRSPDAAPAAVAGEVRAAGVIGRPPGLKVDVQEAVAGWRWVADGRGLASLACDGTFTNAGLAMPGMSLDVSPASGRVAWDGVGARAELRSDRLVLGPLALAGLAATATGALDRIAFRVTCADLPGAALRGSVAMPGGRFSALEAGVPLDVGPADPVGRMLREASGFEVSGHADLALDLRADAAMDDGFLTVTVRDAVARKEKFVIEGISGAVALAGLAPLRSAGVQRVAARRLEMGGLSLTNATAAFRADGPRGITVEEARLDWGGGRFFCTAFPLDPAAGALKAMVFCEGLDLADVLKATAGGKVSGAGRFNGRLPLGVRWSPHPAVSVGAGYLYSVPGTGTLAIEDRELLDTMVSAAAGPQGGSAVMEPVRRKVEQAFRDFQYSTIRADFTEGTRNRPSGVIRIMGRGNQKDGVPLDLTVRFAVDLL